MGYQDPRNSKRKRKRTINMHAFALGTLLLSFLTISIFKRNFLILSSQVIQSTVDIRESESGQTKTISEYNESTKFRYLSNVNSTAWVTYVEGDGGEYLLGVLALYGSIKIQSQGFNDTFILVVFCGELTESALSLFEHTTIEVRNYCPVSKLLEGSNFDGQQINWKTLNKLVIFEVKKEFHRLIFVDADIHFLNSPVNLIPQTSKPGFYAVLSQQSKERFNSGLFVVVGNFEIEDLYRDLNQMLACEGGDCNKYVDRMSKIIDDQGFLNSYYANTWIPLSDYYNVKVMFYIKEKMWGRRKINIKRKEVIGLHWIGPSKPWQPNIKFPCGNTKKYCFCNFEENLALQYVHSRWVEDLNSILILQNRTFHAINKDLKQKNAHVELRSKHQDAKTKLCRKTERLTGALRGKSKKEKAFQAR